MLTPAELAKKAKVRRQMIFNYLATSRINGIRTEEGWRIPEEEAERWIAAREAKAAAKKEKIKKQLRGVNPF